MEVAIFLLFCGFLGALGFNCEVPYPEECRHAITINFDFQVNFPETAAELDDFCNIMFEEVKCIDAFTKACPETNIATVSGAVRESTDSFISFLNKVCDKEKYFEKANCFKKESESIENHCQETVTENGLCKRVTEVVKCVEDELINRCGSDGRNLVSELFKQRYAVRDLMCSLE